MSEAPMARLGLHFGPYQFEVTVHGIQRAVTVSTREVCEVDGQPISYLQICEECNGIVQESVAGTPAPAPIKQRYCTNQRCGKQVEGKVESVPFCTKCRAVVTTDKVEDAYQYGGGLFRISAEQFASLKALRLVRGIHVMRALNADQQPSLRYVRGTLQLRPGNKDSDVRAFNDMCQSAIKQRLSFAAFSVLKDEQAHQTFAHENGALIQFEVKDGQIYVFLVQLYGEHELNMSVPSAPLVKSSSTPLLSDTVDLHQSLTNPVDEVNWSDYAATPGTRSFHGLLESIKQGRAFEVLKPMGIADKAVIVANRLVESSKAYDAEQKRLARVARKASRAAQAAAQPVVAATSNNDTPSGEANPTT